MRAKRVWVAGHRGMVGSATIRRLAQEDCEILTSQGVDLRRQSETDAWMERERPDVVIMAAARVGGINANNTRPGEFLYDNLMIAANVVEASRRLDVGKLLFLGSSCIYPRMAPQPMSEDALLTGPLEPTNEWYGIAKITGLKLCEAYRRQYGCDFISAQPTNLYGPNDNYDLKGSHVIPALIRKFHEAKQAGASEVEIWGSGAPKREFLHVNDLADALVFLLKNYSGDQHVNVGWGEEISIADLAELIAQVVGFRGSLRYDRSMPDGAPRKLLDVTKLSALGWRPQIRLREGLGDAYRWFTANEKEAAPA
ncbi:MAG: GDP-L-fucose synthase [Hyphomonadaceae bacterium]|nr:GDP-L-fucose synthase [Hyphomonadaceae bacterium]